MIFVRMLLLVVAVWLASVIFSGVLPALTGTQETTVWNLPSCPRELTLQDGSRWAPPQWSDPGCRATIGWMLEE